VKRGVSTSQPFVPGLLLLAALCLYAVIRTPFSAEEAAILGRARAPLPELVRSPYGPLYWGLLHVWSALGEHPIWLRLLSALCGLAVLPLGQRVVRALGGTHATPGTLLLLGAAPFMVAQSSRLSPASPGLVPVLVCFLCFLEFARAGDWRWLAGWLAAVLASLAVHAGFIWAVGVQCLIFLLYRERYRHRHRLWWPVQLVPLGVLWWRLGPALQDYFTARLPAALDASLFADGAAGLVRLSTNLPLPAGLAGGLLFAVLLVSGLWACRDWRRDPRHGLLVLSLVVPCLIWVCSSRRDSYLLMPLVCGCTLASMGLRLYPRWARQMLWSAAAVVYLWSYWNFFG